MHDHVQAYEILHAVLAAQTQYKSAHGRDPATVYMDPISYSAVRVLIPPHLTQASGPEVFGMKLKAIASPDEVPARCNTPEASPNSNAWQRNSTCSWRVCNSPHRPEAPPSLDAAREIARQQLNRALRRRSLLDRLPVGTPDGDSP